MPQISVSSFHGSLGHPHLDWGWIQVLVPVDQPAAPLQTLRPQNNVVGRLCNECSDGSFHLSKQNPDGCLKCFCMGVSRQCSSSSWSRAQVPARGQQLDGTATPGAGGTEGGHHHPNPLPDPNIPHLQVLGASEQPSQFSLTNAAGTHTTSEGVSSPAPGELLFSSFHNLLSEPYFWSLPASFRGDKVGRQRNNTGREGIGRLATDSVARLKSLAKSLSTPVPGDVLRRRAAVHRDPAAPAWFCTPAQTATGGVAGQQHCIGAPCLKGAQPWPAQQLHSALPRGEPHPVPSCSSLLGPQHAGCQEWISCHFLYSNRGNGLMGSQPHGSTC